MIRKMDPWHVYVEPGAQYMPVYHLSSFEHIGHVFRRYGRYQI